MRLSSSLGHAMVAADPGGDAFVEPVAGGVAVFTGLGSPMNKMIGVGFADSPPIDRLDAIEQQFRTRVAPLQAEVSTLADPGWVACLTRRGYVLEGFENVLGRPITLDTQHRGSALDQALTAGLEIDLAHEADALPQWLDVAITGFLQPDGQGVPAPPLSARRTLERTLRVFNDAPGFRRYFATIDGQLAGVATARFDDNVAQLCGAATLPEFRRRGIQTALLRRRLMDASREGCSLAVMTTQPGSKSQENGHRQGFVLLYSRALLVKPPGAT